MATPKLTYFDGNGRADMIRFLLTDQGVSFEDIRLSREEWAKFAEDHKDKIKFGQLPILEIDDKTLAQSEAILIYLAMKFGVHYETPEENYSYIVFMNTMNDIYKRIEVKSAGEPDPTKKTECIKTELEGRLKLVFQSLEAFAKENKVEETGWLIGGRKSTIDYVYIPFLERTERMLNSMGFSDYVATTTPALWKYSETHVANFTDYFNDEKRPQRPT
mmetsp:Transcript_34261/g.38858  ORF Transcript_34261/g.38858 Transcript_34261/m.38858 type:complete len:218 (+) Transcript_34261:46-699(+)|eukprot:CAMPEP_0115000258 /NCGR_PEP_ID=MMETSP0216-20121206/16649_1 /TAXON_ID=223996 /ORGANISM="Protocruzia adherens, Strain Boccale" /LENGTH=217 /DNA_ID=CAMNT_0002365319 /DNA_START=42 /DNA_END=695 /DNA_ORIENTATION=+